MARVIVLQEMLRPHVKLASRPSGTTGVKACGSTAPLPVEEPREKEGVDRAILLLGIAARQTRLLAKQINDPLRRENFEAQIATIEQLLQLARDMAMKL